MLNISCIGAGRLGRSMLKILGMTKLANIRGVFDLSFSNAVEAVEFAGFGEAYSSLEEIPISDIYLLPVQDDHISSVCKDLIDKAEIKSGSIIIHFSGARSSRDLDYARKCGCLVASIHPVMSFAIPEIAVANFKGVYCGLEGDEGACKVLKVLFEKMGGRIFDICGNKKSLYHAAIAMTNNYLTTLHYYGKFLFHEANIDKEISKNLLMEMMSGSLKNLLHLSEKDALTGLVCRGDINTLKEEIGSLENYALVRDIYCTLGKATISLTKHNEETKGKLENIFKSFGVK